jgi:hypothetical protein
MYSKGISWISDCRIPFVDEKDNNTTRDRYDTIGYGSKMNNGWGSMDDSAKQGRFPANLLVSDDMLNDGSVSSIKQNKDYIPPNEANSIHNYSRGKYSGIQDKGTNSRYYDIDRWFNNLIDV